MPGPRDQDDRHWRLFQFSQDWGMTLPPSPPQPEPAGIAMSFKSASDDAYAEEYLKLRQSELAVQNSPPKGTRTKKGWGPKFVYAVLNDHVTDCGSPAVGESLIDILHSAGGDVNSPPSEKGGIMHRISRHSPGQQRGKLLETAVRNEQADMVRVLAPHSDAMALDLALPIAIRSHNVEVTSILLGYGASTAQTEESQNAFREICAHAEHCNLVGLIVHSKGRPSPEVVSQALVCAVRAGCVENAIHLSRTIGNGNYNGCEALKVAIAGCRRDLALAVIMGSHPPQRPGVNEAFDVLRQTPMSQGQALEFAEILLLAGAEGDTLSAALIKYGEMGFLDMVQLLVRYGASVEFKKGRVLQKAIKALNMDLLQILLGNESNISPVYASGCVDLLPKDIPFEKRHTLLRMLLRKGAAELALNDALIDAAEAGDAESVELLLNPVFPEISTAHPLHIGPRYSVLSQSTARHETASVDYKNGLALQRAVSRGDVVMTQKLLLGIPNMGTLTAAFPITSNLSRPDRYQIIEAFLEAGLSGPPIDASLHIAIAEDPNERDDDLIHLLLEHGADVNFNGGQGLPSVIELGDVELLTELLGTASQETSANAIASAIQLEDEELRLQIVKLLLEHCAGIALAQVSAALAEVLQEEPADMELLQLLLEEGQADVNAYEGKLLSMGGCCRCGGGWECVCVCARCVLTFLPSPPGPRRGRAHHVSQPRQAGARVHYSPHHGAGAASL
jgi:ankyrin repeat protein